MSDKVMPLNTAPRLGTFNGFGRTMLGKTRPDAEGACFATHWFTMLLPIWPLGRYYIKEGETVVVAGGRGASASTTQYVFLGRAELRMSEVIRTYLFFWVMAPLVVAGPVTLFGIDGDAFSRSHPITFLVLLIVIPIVCLIALAWMLVFHEKFLASARVPEWVGAGPANRSA
ncbi:hypothetical protein ACFVT1_22770 [Streptomyces sp. NPDC057963]|uniref:hypothetical protein n=1 Tax=Streptomyces sp. NPDC057963 TaxID=3346290 RepID=UPI0036E2A7D3